MNAERIARLLVIGFAVGAPIVALIGQPNAAPIRTIEIHGVQAETGGWTPGDLTATVGESIHLRLTSDDVMHGFAIGQSDQPAVDVKPGQVTETTIVFDRPGKYTFYCTRWCGLNHWRMRGTIEVSGPASDQALEPAPLYVTLGLDIDAPHPAEIVPDHKPSAARGAELGVVIPPVYLGADYYRAHSPVEAWRALRAEPFARTLNDAQVWDLVARVWKSNTTPQAIDLGRQLYAANCAACHGEYGAGDGVMAEALANSAGDNAEHGIQVPANFSDAAAMLGASPALLQGKITRGGMGSGMPYWGPILTEAQTWAVVDYVWTFQFLAEDTP